MTDYKPRVGDKVEYRIDHPNGTIQSQVGVIHRIDKDRYASCSEALLLYSPLAPERTTLLERPLVTEAGTVYGDPRDAGQRLVRLKSPADDANESQWLGAAPAIWGGHWFPDRDVKYLIQEYGWVRMDLDGNVIDDD